MKAEKLEIFNMNERNDIVRAMSGYELTSERFKYLVGKIDALTPSVEEFHRDTIRRGLCSDGVEVDCNRCHGHARVRQANTPLIEACAGATWIGGCELHEKYGADSPPCPMKRADIAAYMLPKDLEGMR